MPDSKPPTRAFILLILCATLLNAAATTVSAETHAPAGPVVAGRTTITLPDTLLYTSAERAILALERERSAAIARGDTTWLATLYAPDFEAIVGNGRRITRADLFKVFGRDDPESRFAIDELAVRAYAAAATVTGRLRFLGAGDAVTAESRYTHVYIERDGHWWIVRAQATAVPPPVKP